jgi:hypothetical protein
VTLSSRSGDVELTAQDGLCRELPSLQSGDVSPEWCSAGERDSREPGPWGQLWIGVEDRPFSVERFGPSALGSHRVKARVAPGYGLR